METVGGDGSEIGSVTKKKEKNRRPVSMPAAPLDFRDREERTTIVVFLCLQNHLISVKLFVSGERK